MCRLMPGMEGSDYARFLRSCQRGTFREATSQNQISPHIAKLGSPRPWYILEAKSINELRKRSDKFLEAKTTGNY